MNRGFRAISFVVALLGTLLSGAASTALAQDKFDKPVRILVGFPAGGTADLIARVVADKLKDSLGVPVIVDNRPGAIGRIAAEAVKNAAPDGTTIMVMPIGPMAVVPHSTKNLNYDPLKDFTPIALGRDVPVRDRRGSGKRREELAGIRGLGQGEPGQGGVRDLGCRQPAALFRPAAFHRDSACRCCTSRTRGRRRTSTT